MINQNNINKYGVECYKTAYQLIQKLRGQELMIIESVKEQLYYGCSPFLLQFSYFYFTFI